jgi:ABC-2 type transport system permease protein
MMLPAFRTDWAKQWRRPLTYILLGLLMALPIIFTIAFKANPPSPPEHFDAGDRIDYFASQTGLYMGVAALQNLSRFGLEVVIAIFAGVAVASEATWGNLRALLVRPIPRGRLLGAKLITVVLLAAVATALVVATGLVAGSLAFGWHPLAVGGLHQSTGSILGHLAIASGYVLWSLSSILTLGFLVSTTSDSPFAGVAAAFGLYVVSQILDAITSLGSIRYALPTHYFDAWQHLFAGNGHGPTADMLRGTLLPIAYVLTFLGLAFWWFRRKDILS